MVRDRVKWIFHENASKKKSLCVCLLARKVVVVVVVRCYWPTIMTMMIFIIASCYQCCVFFRLAAFMLKLIYVATNSPLPRVSNLLSWSEHSNNFRHKKASRVYWFWCMFWIFHYVWDNSGCLMFFLSSYSLTFQFIRSLLRPGWDWAFL